VQQPASARVRNEIATPHAYYWVMGHCEWRDKWTILECSFESWNETMIFSFLAVVHNTGTPPCVHEYSANVATESGMHIYSPRHLSTGFNGSEGLVVSAFTDSFYMLDFRSRTGCAGQWPQLATVGWRMAARMADHPIAYSSDHGWILEVRGGCVRHAVLLGLQPGPPKTSKLFKFLFREKTFWLWLDGAGALFSDNWSAPHHVDTASGYHLYVIDTLTNETKTLVYTGLRSFHVRILTWVDFHEKLIKYDRMNGQIVMVTRIRNRHGNSKYRVYVVTVDLDRLTFSTMLRIIVPYGEYYDGILDLSFSFDADKFCAKDTTPGLDARLMFYSLQVPTLRAAAYQAVARQREDYNWFWVLGRLGAWMKDLFRF
jgi:hypothetical protein